MPTRFSLPISRRLSRWTSAAVIAAAMTMAPAMAQAQLFSTGLGTGESFRDAALGPGQRVTAAQTTQVTSFGFWMGVEGTVDLKFMIWDAAGANILFQQVKTVSSVAPGSLVMSNPMSFTMNAGQTYEFAVLGNGNYSVSFFFNPPAVTQNGLSLAGANRNYGPYGAPVLKEQANATMAIRIDGTQTTVPEPTSVALFSVGLTALGIAARRKRRQ